MSLKLYYNLFSQPSRALYIFLKKCNIPFESKIINLAKGEHYQPEYEKINPFKKVPVIDHNGFKLIESVAIFRYLCREYNVSDYWYPKDSKAQAKVDEYLEWQHLNTRFFCASYFRLKVMVPLMKGRPASPEKVTASYNQMINFLDEFERMWLKDKLFITGNKISIADILAACEIEQLKMAGYDPREGRPILSSWLDRVSEETSPAYNEAHGYVDKYVEKLVQQSKL